jgi:hypothetical protein
MVILVTLLLVTSAMVVMFVSVMLDQGTSTCAGGAADQGTFTAADQRATHSARGSAYQGALRFAVMMISPVIAALAECAEPKRAENQSYPQKCRDYASF